MISIMKKEKRCWFMERMAFLNQYVKYIQKVQPNFLYIDFYQEHFGKIM